MNCEEVSNHLSDYLDKSLETATTTRVATHIISCTLCRSESKSLADCISQVGALPMVDPPLGFAQRVMAHVRELEPKPSLWQRLLLAFPGKRPLQAAAVIIVAVLAGFLYQKEAPRNDAVNLALQSAASETSDKQVLAPAQAPSTATSKQNAVPGTETAIELPGQAALESAPRNVAPSAKPSEKPQPPVALKAEVEASFAEQKTAVKRAPIQVQGVTAARDSGIILGDPRGFTALPQIAGVRPAAPRPAPLALERAVPLGDRVADLEFVVRRPPSLQREIAEHLGAAAPRIESIAEIKFYNVAPEHLESFKKDLAGEAQIESETRVGAKNGDALPTDRQLLIKVTILPLESAASR